MLRSGLLLLLLLLLCSSQVSKHHAQPQRRGTHALQTAWRYVGAPSLAPTVWTGAPETDKRAEKCGGIRGHKYGNCMGVVAMAVLIAETPFRFSHPASPSRLAPPLLRGAAYREVELRWVFVGAEVVEVKSFDATRMPLFLLRTNLPSLRRCSLLFSCGTGQQHQEGRSSVVESSVLGTQLAFSA